MIKFTLLGTWLLKKLQEQKVTSVSKDEHRRARVCFGGVFIYVGLDPVSEFATELGILDEMVGWSRMII